MKCSALALMEKMVLQGGWEVAVQVRKTLVLYFSFQSFAFAVAPERARGHVTK
jgi:hypothetical protein